MTYTVIMTNAACIRRLRILALLPILGLLLVASPTRAQLSSTQPGDQAQTIDSALYLLKKVTTVQRNGEHHVMLLALRQLHDPDLAPLFRSLLQTDSPSLRTHGFLGMAECQTKPSLDLAYLATIKDPKLQAEMISAAMDNDLLTPDLAKQALTWADLDMTVKLLVAAQLMQAGPLEDMTLLKQALASDNLGRQGLAAVMLTQLKQPEGLETLRKVDQSADVRRDQVREMLLGMALKFSYDQCAPWALELATNPQSPSRLSLIGLQTALKFHAPGATEAWHKQFTTTTDAALRTRLALVALNLATWMEPKLYEPMIASDEPLLRQMGLTGQAVASKRDIADNAVALVMLRHPLATDWAMRYARKDATGDDATRILTAVVNAYVGPERNKAQRLDDVVAATQMLVDRDASAAGNLIKPILTNPKADPLLQQALLLGLLRVTSSRGVELLQGVPASEHPDVRRLTLLLLAKNNQPLNADQMQDLSLLVRGGSDLPDFLRVQAAWAYLKRINQAQAVLTQVVGK